MAPSTAAARPPSELNSSTSKDNTRLQLLDKSLKRFQYQQDALIEVLHAAQESFGHLDAEILDYVSIQLKLPPSWVYGVATFYNFFTLEPQGDHVCVVCMGTPCYVKGAGEIVARLEEIFDVKAGATTEDKKLTLMTARCLGTCGLAPMLTLDGEVLGKQTPESTTAAIQKKLADADNSQENDK
ncbi:bidirectional hydrogenase complex protein HoxE [Geoalkalibacter halelectricus]|uniref:Bidirectional hydrogenase complex protein HoxE n=1 Tax=Geoalkalibacter halelectricus TaxID=2847045 RepID=A0ABY5ZH37_9BACT|nr:bidirectional hydrogenase complex protein HoxE [Geoalkalibacter halelectricus]MDO3376621.1 bidirectional hydrogenase complex protein HoxE [Geoalkalibacter halelectricus]UWZ78421.1 bidirectional hydrogenase complex protein HoxE [Geoalkalibacter halelectricus]